MSKKNTFQFINNLYVTVLKERKICLACKGKLEGLLFICPECNSLYCRRCFESLSKSENACWTCNSPFDKTKQVKLYEEQEKYKLIHIEMEKKAKGKENLLPIVITIDRISNIVLEINDLLEPEIVKENIYIEKVYGLKDTLEQEITEKISQDYFIQIKEKFNLIFQKISELNLNNRKEIKAVKHEQKLFFKTILEKLDLVLDNSSHIEGIVEDIDDLEQYLKHKLSSSYEKIKSSINAYKKGKIDKTELIKRGIMGLGKGFIKIFYEKAV